MTLHRASPGAGDRAHLEHQAQLVGDTPVLHRQPVLEAEDVEHIDGHLPAGRRVAHHGPGVDAARPVAGPHDITRDREVLHGQREVGHPRVEGHGDGLRAVPAGPVATLVLHDVGGHELVQDREVALAHPLLDEAAGPIGKVVRGHGALLLIE